MKALLNRSSCIILTCILVLSACQKQHKPLKKFNDWKQVSTWSFNGKMAITDGHNSGSGRISWRVTPNSTHAKFNAPLGQGNWDIFEQENKARLISSKHGEKHANTAEVLILEELGWHFPWNNLQYWLRGYKKNDNLAIHHTTIDSIFDEGWDITYQKWVATPIGLLPKKIKASKYPYSVKLIIYSWEIE